MSDYQAAQQEENMRNPKNRFLGLFCHASEVGDSWGFNWPFWCGVLMFSILIGVMTLIDISHIFTEFFKVVTGWFAFWFVVRMISDFIALIGIIFSAISCIQNNFSRATIAYYCMILSLVLNSLFIGYCIFRLFDGQFWKITTYRLIVWLCNEFVLFLFCWILFCNMVVIGRKARQQAASNPF